MSWEASERATEYRVYRSDSEAGLKTELGAWLSETQYLDASAAVSVDYWYWVKARNESGESGFSAAASGRCMPDETPPVVVVMTTPRFSRTGMVQVKVIVNEELAAVPALGLDVLDDQFLTISFQAQEDNEYLFEVSLLEGADEGEYVLSASAEDTSGNVGTATGYFAVDHTPPALSIDLPASVLGGGTHLVTVRAAEPLETAPEVQIEDAAGNKVSFPLESISGLSYRYVLEIGPEFASGQVAYKVFGYDRAGNLGEIQGAFLVDNMAPVLEVDFPSLVGVGTTYISVTLQEILPKAPTVQVRNTSGARMKVGTPLVTGNEYRFPLVVSFDEMNGMAQLEVIAEDLSSNQARESRSFEIDTVPAELEVVLDPDPPVGGAPLLVIVSASEELSGPPELAVSADGVNSLPVENIHEDQGTTFTYEVAADSFSVVGVEAFDQAGNRSETTVSRADLRISVEGILLSKPSGTGVDVTACVTVENSGSTPLVNIPFVIRAGTVELEQLLEETLVSLEPGASMEICAQWAAEAQPDSPVIAAYVDPDNQLVETDESNNFAVSAPIRVAFEDARSTYLLDERDVTIGFALVSSFTGQILDSMDVTSTATIETAEGDWVADLTVVFNEESGLFEIPLNFPELVEEAGDYLLVLNIIGQHFPPTRTEQSLKLIEDFSLVLETDQQQYDLSEPVEISGTVLELDGDPLPNLPVSLMLTARYGQRRFSLQTSEDGDFSYTYRPSANEAGPYELVATSTFEEIQRRSGPVQFSIFGLKLRTNLNQATVYTGARETFDYLVENLGTEPLTEFQFTLISSGTGGVLPGAVIDTGSFPSVLQPGQSATIRLVLPIAQQVGEADYRITITTAEGAFFEKELSFMVTSQNPRVQFEPGHLEKVVPLDGQATETVRLVNRGWHDVTQPFLESSLPEWASLSGLGGDVLQLPGNKGLQDAGFGPLVLYSLIGRVGSDGEPFQLGRDSEARMPSDGTLFLRMNEADADLQDNAGALRVKITGNGIFPQAPVNVLGSAGWQETGIDVVQGQSIRVLANGVWEALQNQPRDADGNGCIVFSLGWFPRDEALVSGAVQPFDWEVQFSGGNLSPVALPLRTWVTADATGTVEFHFTDTIDRGISDVAVDLYSMTYDPIQGEYPIFKGTSDQEGWTSFTGLVSGKYGYVVRIDGYLNQSGEFELEGGGHEEFGIVLENDFVTVEWDVTETTIADKYDIVLRTTYKPDNGYIPPVLIAPPIEHTLRPAAEIRGTINLHNAGDLEAENVELSVSRFALNLNGVEVYFLKRELGESGQTLKEVSTIVIDSIRAKESVGIEYLIRTDEEAWSLIPYLGNISVDAEYRMPTFGDQGVSEVRNKKNSSIGIRLWPPQNRLIVDPPAITKVVTHDFNVLNLPKLVDEIGEVSIFNPSDYSAKSISPPTGVMLKKGVGVTDLVSLVAGVLTGGATTAFALSPDDFVWITGMVDYLGGDTSLDPGESAIMKILEFKIPASLKAVSPVDMKLLSISAGMFGFSALWGIPGGPVVAQLPDLYFVPVGIISIVRGTSELETSWHVPSSSGDWSAGGGGSVGGGSSWGGWGSIGNVSIPQVKNGNSITFDIHQEVTFDRQAFEAELRLTNGSEIYDLDDVQVDIILKDEDGNTLCSDHRECETLFFAEPELSGIGSLDGIANLGPRNRANGNWLIVPTPASGGRSFLLQARVTFLVDGAPQTIESLEERIDVKPLPLLHLDYFMPEKFAAGVPFELGVIASNRGEGDLKNLEIVTHQPEIVWEETQSPFLFKPNLEIENAGVSSGSVEQYSDGRFLSTFGDLAPGACKAGWWTLRAFPGGRVTQFFAKEVKHDEALGGELTSLVSVSTRTHRILRSGIVGGMAELRMTAMQSPDELTSTEPHLILIDSDEDGIADYLVETHTGIFIPVRNETAVTVDLPTAQTPHLKLLVNEGANWFLAQADDPFSGFRGIEWVARDDGSFVPSENVWLEAGRIQIIDQVGGAYTINYSDGGEAALATGLLKLNQPSYEGTETPVIIMVEDSNANLTPGSGNDIVFAWAHSDAEPDWEQIQLDESDIEGQFLGQFTFSQDGIEGDGSLKVDHKGLFRVDYIDAANYQGVAETVSVHGRWSQPGHPEIVQGPSDTVAFVDRLLVLSAEAIGEGPLTYRWFRNGAQIYEGDTGLFFLSNLNYSDAGEYQVVVSNDLGQAASNIAQVTIRSDRDGDGLADDDEINLYLTNPDDWDSDGDGLSDGAEIFDWQTDPLVQDSDQDGHSDFSEIYNGRNPKSADDYPPLLLERDLAVELVFPGDNGGTYAIWRTSDLHQWNLLEQDIAGTGGLIRRFYSTRDSAQGFFAVEDQDGDAFVPSDIFKALEFGFPSESGGQYLFQESADFENWQTIGGIREGTGHMIYLHLSPFEHPGPWFRIELVQ
ncbi:MAG: CARDB domain-containing protein [Verrucomicrobiota bacterium]|nr:CARDB domain-containing protein [Verrucomicrobiota bacterium]